VTPGPTEQRTELALNSIAACQEAKIKFILCLSVLSVEAEDTIFGKQFIPIEKVIKDDVGEGGAMVRLPLFINSFYAQAESIKTSGTFYESRDTTKGHTPVSVADIGKACADILAAPEKHRCTVYKIIMPSFCLDDVAQVFSKTLCTTVPYQAAKESFMSMGFPEWQVDGIMELYKMCDEDNPIVNETTNTSDIETITGEKPMTVQEWVEANKAGFS